MSGPGEYICTVQVAVPHGQVRTFHVERSTGSGALYVEVVTDTGTVKLSEDDYVQLRMLFEDIGGNIPKR